MCSVWLSTAQEKNKAKQQQQQNRLPRVLMGKNTRFSHLAGSSGIQILDYSFRSPVLNIR